MAIYDIYFLIEICKYNVLKKFEKKSSTDIILPQFKEEFGFYTTPSRSKRMSNIRGKNTKPEIILRKEFWAKGFRYRINWKKLPGKPDIVFNKYKTVVFVDGEFWHGYNWEVKKTKIKANRDFWIPKIERNILRDQENNEALEKLGYTVFRFWQEQIIKDLQGCVSEVIEHFNSM